MPGLMRALLVLAVLASPAWAEDQWGRVADWTKIDVWPDSPGTDRVMLIFDTSGSAVDLVIFSNENIRASGDLLFHLKDFASNGIGPGNTPFLIEEEENRTWVTLVEERFDAPLRPFSKTATMVFENGQPRLVAYDYEEFKRANGAEFSCELYADGAFEWYHLPHGDAEESEEVWGEGTYDGPPIMVKDGFRTANLPPFCAEAYQAWNALD